MEILIAIELIAAVFVIGSWCKNPGLLMSRRYCQHFVDPYEEEENDDARIHPRAS
jgi:hypothetical protein